MSDEPDKESKTEDPSEKRIRDAIEKGNIPFSQEAGILSSIAAILVIGLMTAGPTISSLSNRLGIIIENAATLDLSNGSDAFRIIMSQVWAVFMIALPVLAVLSIGGLLGQPQFAQPQRVLRNEGVTRGDFRHRGSSLCGEAFAFFLGQFLA